MKAVKTILLVVYIIVCVALILITTFQNKDNKEAIEDTYDNPNTNKYFAKNKGRTKTGKVQKNTIILGVLFAVLSIATCIVYVLPE